MVMIEGRVVWFNDAKGYGFIQRGIDTRAIFVHYTGIKCEGFPTLKEGQNVSFELIEVAKGLQAINVEKLD